MEVCSNKATQTNNKESNMNGDINQFFAQIINLYNNKGNPNAMMQSLYQQTPNINQVSTQFNNMMQGKSRPEAYMQMAKQLGLNEQNLQGLAKILGVKQ